MMIIVDPLICYKAHLTLTEKMQECVSQQDWDALVALQTAYDQSSEALMDLPMLSDHDLSEAERNEFDYLISQINKNQSHLNQALVSQQHQLGELIHDTVNQRSKIKHYYDVARLI